MNPIILKDGKEQKILNFYQWVFWDDIHRPPDNTISPGPVTLLSAKGVFIAKGFYNPNARIPVKIITLKEEPAEVAIQRKISIAVEKRKDRQFGRLVFAESDFLPGIIVDRFGSYLVMQIRLEGYEPFIENISDTLIESTGCEGILLRNDFETLREKISRRDTQLIYGDVPREPVIIRENNLSFYVDLWAGQKTGYFYDQQSNRNSLANLVSPGMNGLDLYTYTGSFALTAAAKGANMVAVDKSEDDILLAEKNARLNSLEQNVSFVVQDVDTFLRDYKEEVDFIVCDPPGLVKKKSELKRGQYLLVDILMKSLSLLKKTAGWWSSVVPIYWIINS